MKIEKGRDKSKLENPYQNTVKGELLGSVNNRRSNYKQTNDVEIIIMTERRHERHADLYSGWLGFGLIRYFPKEGEHLLYLCAVLYIYIYQYPYTA